MYSAFGLYISVVGIALVFATLLAIGLLSEAARRVFYVKEEPGARGSRLAKVAATAAVLMLTENKGAHKPHPITEGDERWRVAARMEALDRGIRQER